MAGRRTSQIKNWVLGDTCKLTCAWDAFGLLVFKIIWGSFGALNSKWPVTRTQLAIEQNGVNFGTLGVIVICIWGTFDLLVFRVILGVIQHTSQNDL